MNDLRDPHRPFEEIVQDLNREHRSRHKGRTALHSRPRTRRELERRQRFRWTLAVVVGLGLAVAVALLMPT